VSTDLKSATDLLPLDLVAAIVSGLEDSGKVPAWEIEVLRVLTGPQDLVYPDGDQVRTSRGILMGLPTSWALLSLIHLWWWNDSVRLEAAERRVKLGDAFRANRFMTCGDDGLACCWTGVSSRYSLLVRACGGAESPGKHFVVDRSVRPRAVFIERLFEFATEDGRIVGGYRNGAIPLRGLVRPEQVVELRGNGPGLMVPPRLKLLLSVDSVFSSQDSSKPALLRFLKSRRWLRDFGISLGLVDGLPLREGGTGLPIAGPDTVAMKERRWRAHHLRANGDTVTSILRGVIDPAWQLASELSKGDLSAFVEQGTFVRVPVGADPPKDTLQRRYVLTVSWEDVVQNATEGMYSEFVLSMGMGPGRKPKLREKSLRRAIVSKFNFPIGVVDLDQLPTASDESVYVERTRAPDGSLLYPRWAGETLASEAAWRALCFAELARFTRA